MKNDKQNDEKSPCSSSPPKPNTHVPLQPAGEAVVNLDEAAAKPPPAKKIHPRRPLPPIPERDDT
jgi:hypothetical protein